MTVETDLTGPMVQYENTGVKKIAGYFIKILNVFLIPIATTKVKSTWKKVLSYSCNFFENSMI